MNWQEAEELVPSYLLGALDERERAQVEAHIRECPTCLAQFHDYGPVATLLSAVGDSLQPPPELRQQLMGRLGPQPSPATESRAPAGVLRAIGRSIRRPLTVAATAVVAISITGLGVGASLLWSEVRELRSDNTQLSSTLQAQISDNTQLSFSLQAQISELEAQHQFSASLQDQLDQMKEEDQRLSNLLSDQRDLAYTAAMPGISTVLLEGTDVTPQSKGIFIISPSGTWGMLTALSLKPLPQDKAYQIWLIGSGTRTSGGLFTVDETGYGQLRVRGEHPITDYWALGVSIEPVWGSDVPTGDKVLGGTYATYTLP